MKRSVACTFAVAAAAALATGCAPTELKEDEEQYRAPTYRTGSNLPTGRESGQVSTRELTPAERKALEEVQNRVVQPRGQTK